jgi:hypothetical protein
MLEADWYCHHYPSPEGVSVAQGGFAMDCRGENPAPLSEFVHQQIDHKLEHWTSTKSKPSLAEMADPIGLLDQRRYHHECLLSRFGQSARRWSA